MLSTRPVGSKAGVTCAGSAQYTAVDRSEMGEVVVLPATPKSALDGPSYSNGAQLTVTYRRDTASLPNSTLQPERLAKGP